MLLANSTILCGGIGVCCGVVVLGVGEWDLHGGPSSNAPTTKPPIPPVGLATAGSGGGTKQPVSTG